MLKLLASATAAIVLLTAPVFAENKSALTAEEIAAALSAAGMNPQQATDVATGAPVFVGEMNGASFVVRALDCAGEPTACENLLFFANFSLDRAVSEADYLIINRFNDSELFGRAYVLGSRNEIGVEYVLDMGGGVSTDHIAQNISRWADIIAAFIENFQQGTS